MRDLLVWLGLAFGFAAFATSHLAIALGLVSRTPRWRAAVAFLVPPLAPYWAFGERLYVRGALWLASVLGYVVLRWYSGA